MNIDKIKRELDLEPDKETIEILTEKKNEIVSKINKIIKENNIRARVFAGGSFAKGTLLKSNLYEIDLFVRFDIKNDKVNEEGKRLIEKLEREGINFDKIHGSRDYYRTQKGNIIFEIVPVKKINKPKEAENVTDLSYFHVNYVKNKIRGKIKEDILLAKKFCKARGLYGAESYIQGLSGYGLECLIIYYGSFVKMALSLIKTKDKIIIDPSKYYKGKNILLELNESKINGPIVLIDPTYKERNALASLSYESYSKLKEALIKLFKNPKKEMFETKKIDYYILKEKANKNKLNFVQIKINTNKQKGDIAGTKMKKFAQHIIKETSELYDIKEEYFEYNGENDSTITLIGKPKKEIERRGPPVKLKREVINFKKGKKTYIKNGFVYTKIKVNENLKEFLKRWFEKNSKKIKEMDIDKIDLI